MGDTLEIGKTEVLELSPISNTHFKITRYSRITHYGKPSWKKDTSELITKSFSGISKDKIGFIIKQLNTSKDNFKIEFIKPKLHSSMRNEITKIALSDTNSYWRFLDTGYLDKFERKKVIKNIKSFDKLDNFIFLKKPDPKLLDVVATDTWDGLTIYVVNNKNDTLKYTSFFYNLLGQPFNLSKEDVKTGSWMQFINLEMNTAIEAILPNSSLLKKRIGIDSLTTEYIEWYLTDAIK